jgi:hypothetical protein
MLQAMVSAKEAVLPEATIQDALKFIDWSD